MAPLMALRFDGMYVRGERQGAGTETTRHGEYEGMWRHGKRDGVGKYVTAHHWTYRGHWKGGLREGHGVLTSTMGHTFSGTWEDDHLPKGVLTGRFLGRYEGRLKPTGCAPRGLAIARRARARASGALCTLVGHRRALTLLLVCNLLPLADFPNGHLYATARVNGLACAATSTRASGRTTTNMAWGCSRLNSPCSFPSPPPLATWLPRAPILTPRALVTRGRYEGGFQKGQRHGQGVLVATNGTGAWDPGHLADDSLEASPLDVPSSPWPRSPMHAPSLTRLGVACMDDGRRRLVRG